MENNQQSFFQFSDQLRVQTSNLANLSVNDSIWSSNIPTKRTEERRNFDIRVGGEVNSSLSNSNPKGSDLNGFNDGWNSLKPKVSDFNGFNDGWNNLNLKPKGSDFNGFNDGWNNLNLKPKESDFNGLNDGWNSFKTKGTDFNAFNDGWKMGSSSVGNSLILGGSQKNGGINGGFNKGIYSKTGNYNINNNVNVKGYKNNGKGEDDHVGKVGKKNSNGKKNNGDNNNNDSKSGVDKRFKTLPPSESLPRNETVGGYIFVCNNDTMQENLKRQLFGKSLFLFLNLFLLYRLVFIIYFLFKFNFCLSLFIQYWNCTCAIWICSPICNLKASDCVSVVLGVQFVYFKMMILFG